MCFGSRSVGNPASNEVITAIRVRGTGITGELLLSVPKAWQYFLPHCHQNYYIGACRGDIKESTCRTNFYMSHAVILRLTVLRKRLHFYVQGSKVVLFTTYHCTNEVVNT